MPNTVDVIIYRLAKRAGSGGQVRLSSVLGRDDRWYASFNPGVHRHKLEAHGRSPTEALLALEAELDDRGVR